MKDLDPQRFGRYLLLDKVGAGGMAEVFLAKAAGKPGVLAIKRVLASVVEDSEFQTMFVDEARISAGLNHENIAQIFEFGEQSGAYFLAMEHVAGHDLRSVRKHLDRAGRAMPIGVALAIIARVCRALDYAHRHKDDEGRAMQIVHRDVSPPNVIIGYDGEVKLIDFGIAKAASRLTRTRAGKLKGKFAYMSPEQIDGGEIDHRSDIFSAGVVLYEMLTNRRPFDGRDHIETLKQVRKAAPSPPSTLNPEVPLAIDAVVGRAMAKDRERRYGWASELRADIERFFARTGTTVEQPEIADWLKREFAEQHAAHLELMRAVSQLRVGAFETSRGAGLGALGTLGGVGPSGLDFSRDELVTAAREGASAAAEAAELTSDGADTDASCQRPGPAEDSTATGEDTVAAAGEDTVAAAGEDTVAAAGEDTVAAAGEDTVAVEDSAEALTADGAIAEAMGLPAVRLPSSPLGSKPVGLVAELLDTATPAEPQLLEALGSPAGPSEPDPYALIPAGAEPEGGEPRPGPPEPDTAERPLPPPPATLAPPSAAKAAARRSGHAASSGGARAAPGGLPAVSGVGEDSAEGLAALPTMSLAAASTPGEALAPVANEASSGGGPTAGNAPMLEDPGAPTRIDPAPPGLLSDTLPPPPLADPFAPLNQASELDQPPPPPPEGSEQVMVAGELAEPEPAVDDEPRFKVIQGSDKRVADARNAVVGGALDVDSHPEIEAPRVVAPPDATSTAAPLRRRRRKGWTVTRILERVRDTAADLNSTQVILVGAFATLLVVGLVVLIIFGVGKKKAPRRGLSAQTGTLVIATEPPAACSASVDDGRIKRLISPGGMLRIPQLAPGKHSVVLTCAGFKVYRRQAAVSVGQLSYVEAKLTKE